MFWSVAIILPFYFSDFKWVAEDVCEVCLKFYNPLPFELRVANLVSMMFVV